MKKIQIDNALNVDFEISFKNCQLTIAKSLCLYKDQAKKRKQTLSTVKVPNHKGNN